MSGNKPMTITEFLEARIIEDMEQAMAALVMYDPGSYGPTRVLAECATKQFIVTMHQTYAQAASERKGIAALGAECGRDVTEDVLKALARVYGSHPDYRQEWAL